MDVQQPQATGSPTPAAPPQTLRRAPEGTEIGAPAKEMKGIEQGYTGLDGAVNLLESELTTLLDHLEPVLRPRQQGVEAEAPQANRPEGAPLAMVLDMLTKRVTEASGRIASARERLDL